MLPLDLIRKDPERVRRAAALKREDVPIDEILELDRQWRGHQNAAEMNKAEQNRLSKEFAKTRDEQLKEKLREMAESDKAKHARGDASKEKRDDLQVGVRNSASECGPGGDGRVAHGIV